MTKTAMRMPLTDVSVMAQSLVVIVVTMAAFLDCRIPVCHAFVLSPRSACGCWSDSCMRPIATTTNGDRMVAMPFFLAIRNKHPPKKIAPFPSSSSALAALSKRELEIRRKINQLKKEGKIKKNNDDEVDPDDDAELEEYIEKIRQKLGATKSKMLGFGGSVSDDDNDNESAGTSSVPAERNRDEDVDSAEGETYEPRRGQLGALPVSADAAVTAGAGYQRPTGAETDNTSENVLEVDDNENDDDEDDELDEDDLIDLVAQRMQEKRDSEFRERQEHLKQEAAAPLAALEKERQGQPEQETSEQKSKQTTSGVGGAWDSESKTEAEVDMYQPKSGSWGAFPRPRDISKAYGGGRRVGPGYSNEQKSVSSVEETREKLQRYRVKVGIDVESEKEHAGAIEESLKIASVAMQRGMYATAVSALEKVTPYCSTNSKVGGQVFLELAMAYEAVGRTQEAITVYKTLSRSRIEQIKINAKRLLYGIEAIQFMQENVKSSEFSRKRAKRTFIDTTGLDNIASKFDDVYETAYVDLSRSFYRKLTENVVRNSREARQILLRATGPGEVERMKIVQALRSLSRRFADALQDEIDRAKPSPEPTAVMDGKPILKQKDPNEENLTPAMEDFVLMKPDQMLENLSGEWRLQLIADKRGDGVKFFNSTVAWQQVDTDDMSFASLTPQGFFTIQQQGKIKFNSKRRILRRDSAQVTGAAGLAGLFSGSRTGAVGAVNTERQVVTVDSSLLVTRGVPSRRGSSNDDEKDYFAVWRRVERGTFAKK